MIVRRVLSVMVVLFTVIAFNAISAEASTINLTTAASSGSLLGSVGGTAQFLQGATLSGTGVFPSFVQVVGNNPIHAAYNTTVQNVGDNGPSNTFNHAMPLSSVPVITVSSVPYYSFFLDINENNNAIDRYLSLDGLTVLTSAIPNQSTTPLPAIATTRWNMAAGDHVALNFDLEPGSGRSDMEFLVPVSALSGAAPTDFIYLYSSFGSLGLNPAGLPAGDYSASDGFEEWALGRGVAAIPTPEPNALLLLGSGLVGLALAARKKFRT